MRPMLDKIGVNRAQLDSIVEAELGHLPKVTGGSPPQPRPALSQVLEAAQREADAMKDEFVSTEHLLLALTKVDSKAKNVLQAQRRHREGHPARRCRPSAAAPA